MHFTPRFFTLLCYLTFISLSLSVEASEKPNIVLIFCDDLGYGDLSCYGSEVNRTPNIDSLAARGRKFTSFYSSSPVCTPSRASLMTGCYPRRVGMHEDYTGHWVLIPRSRRGLNPDELTMAEMLKMQGYATACIGKWHLGDQPQHLPTNHGFDFYYGIPYSNDMQQSGRGDPPLPLVVNDEVIEQPVDQTTLTRRYTEKTIQFIEENQNQPFFVYLPHTFPHLPLFASDKFRGKSENGKYGDAVEEIDWSTGEIVGCLERLGLTQNTLLVFTSDNGSNGRNGGSNKPLAGAKGSTMEGGMRVPMIAVWPGRISAGSECDHLTSTMDLLPTFAKLVGGELSKRIIDGKEISASLFSDEVESQSIGSSGPNPEVLFYYRRRQLQAIRMGPWKYHLPLAQTHPRWTSPEQTGPGRKGKLVNLETDLRERQDLASERPDIVEAIIKIADSARSELGDGESQGSAQRPAMTLDGSVPMMKN